MSTSHGPLRVGIGGPVGSGKTALMDLLCKTMRERYDIAAITNDIYTKWDAEYLVRSGSLTPDRIAGVETGGCPHTAIREDASMNLAAIADMRAIDEFGVAVLIRKVIERVRAQNGVLHVSFDVDFLDPAVAPGVGTTVPGGATAGGSAGGGASTGGSSTSSGTQ